MNNEKKFVLLRMREGGKLFVLNRVMWEEMRVLGSSFYESEVVAEADEMQSLMRFKELTKEN